MLLITSIGLSLIASTIAQDTNIQKVEAALKASRVIPDVLPANFTPRFPIEVVFTDPTTKKIIPVTAGMNLTMNQTANIPNFAILSNNSMIIGKPYLMVMVDPDAPSPPNRSNSQILHFMGANYVSQNLTSNELFILSNSTAPIAPFMGPHPPDGSIPHRYTIAMYLQGSNNVTVPPGSIPANRSNFNLTNFVNESGNLTLLGATFFLTGPGNTTATNNASVEGNASISSILSGPQGSSTSPATPSSTSTGGAINLDLVAPAVWSVLAVMFGAVSTLL